MSNDVKIQAVIMDIGGVIIRTEDVMPRTRLAQRFGMDRAGLDDLVFGDPLAQAAERGLASEEDVFAGVARKLGLDTAGLAEFRTQFWGGDRLDMGLLDLLAGLRPTYKTALLSNAWLPDLFPLFERYDAPRARLEQALDALVSSAAVGVQKPDPRMYQTVLDRLNVRPEHAVFVDDFQRNIDGALRLGMLGILFQSADQARTDLFRLLGSHE